MFADSERERYKSARAYARSALTLFIFIDKKHIAPQAYRTRTKGSVYRKSRKGFISLLGRQSRPKQWSALSKSKTAVGGRSGLAGCGGGGSHHRIWCLLYRRACAKGARRIAYALFAAFTAAITFSASSRGTSS